MTDLNNETQENARVEYATANAAYMHYDNFTWQVGSILIAGSFAYWGFLLQATTFELLTMNISNLLVGILMSIWMLYSSHNHQIYLFKLHRIHELEKQLGMSQNLRFRKEIKPQYDVWPKGHHLNKIIYFVVCCGSVAITTALSWRKKEFGCINSVLLFLVPCLSIVVISLVARQEKSVRKRIHSFERN